MDLQKPGLPLLQQREIEARIVGPLLRAFAAELGQERALEIVGNVIRELARESGRDLAQALGECTLEAFARTLGRWSQNDALQIEVLEQTPEKLSFNVTRCRYAEMYRALGLADLGGSLSCQHNFALAKDSTPPFNSNAHRRSWKAPHTAISVSRLDAEGRPPIDAGRVKKPHGETGGQAGEMDDRAAAIVTFRSAKGYLHCFTSFRGAKGLHQVLTAKRVV